MTPERFNRLTEVINRRQPDLVVIADEVHKGRNLAAIVRTCDAVGVDKLHSVVPKDGYRPYRGTAQGSQKWVEVCLHPNIEHPIANLKAQNFQLVTTGLSKKAVDFRTLDYTKPTAVILGSEKSGVGDKALTQCDHLVTIPMVGMVESLNVSVAAAVILFEAQAQRTRASMYDHCRLDSKRRKLLFFRWAHPVVAKYCDERNIPYPDVRADGEIIDPSMWYKSVRRRNDSIDILE